MNQFVVHSKVKTKNTDSQLWYAYDEIPVDNKAFAAERKKRAPAEKRRSA